MDSNKITATDYAIYIEGLPKTAGRKDIGQFFRYLPKCTIAEVQNGHYLSLVLDFWLSRPDVVFSTMLK